MAATARDEIIAEWRKHLADAQEPLSPGSPRTAWLTRLKLRLYRFLLSLYGDGRWNASTSTAQEGENAERVMVHDDAMPFSGKAAKDGQQIRAALKSVAEASDARIQVGPLAQGVKRHKLELVQFVDERMQIRRAGLRKTGPGGALVCNLCLAAMAASICVLISFTAATVAGRALGMSTALQTFLRQVVVATLGIFVINAMLYGVFFVRPRK